MALIKCRFGFSCAAMMMSPGLTAKDCPNAKVCGTISQLNEEETIELVRVREIQRFFREQERQSEGIIRELRRERLRINKHEAAILMLKMRGCPQDLEDFEIDTSIAELQELIDAIAVEVKRFDFDYIAPDRANIQFYNVKRGYGVYAYNKLTCADAIFEGSTKKRKVKVIHLSHDDDTRTIEASLGIDRRDKLLRIRTLLNSARVALSEAIAISRDLH